QTTRSVLAHVLDQTLRMLHPYMPFITEEIWQQLPHEGYSITVASWPFVNPQFHDETTMETMEKVMKAIKADRNIRAEVDTPMSKKVAMLIKTNTNQITEQLEVNRHYLERFCNTETLSIQREITVPEQAMSEVITGAEVFLPLEGLIDFVKEIARLEKELEKWMKEVELVQKKLSNNGFVDKSPASVVEAERKKDVEYQEKYTAVEDRLKELQK